MFTLNNGRPVRANITIDNHAPLKVGPQRDCVVRTSRGSHTIIVESADGYRDQGVFELRSDDNEVCWLADNGLECEGHARERLQ